MSAQTVLLDFTVGPGYFETTPVDAHKKTIDLIFNGLKEYFPDLTFLYENRIEGSSFSLFSETNMLITIRCFTDANLITITMEYYKGDDETPRISFDLSREIRLTLENKMDIRGIAYPIIQRSGKFRYFPASDERILEYDIDKVLYDKRSKYQKVQIVHSKSLGNMLVLDELQNISEADLIYTETLMQRGVENYTDKEICILGGGDGALLYELLREDPKFVVMLEIDEMVMQACNQHLRSICGDVLEQRSSHNYEIVLGDCMVQLTRYIEQNRKFDYVFGDLTDLPISPNPTGEIWDFILKIIECSFKILKPNGKYLTHGNGVNCPESLAMFEEQLDKLEPKVRFTKTKAFVPSFMEDWVFYQVERND